MRRFENTCGTGKADRRNIRGEKRRTGAVKRFFLPQPVASFGASILPAGRTLIGSALLARRCPRCGLNEQRPPTESRQQREEAESGRKQEIQAR